MVVNFIREVSPKGPNHAGLGMIVPCLAILSNSVFFGKVPMKMITWYISIGSSYFKYNIIVVTNSSVR